MRMMMVTTVLMLAPPVAAQNVLIDVSDPAVVAAALRDAGYKAELKTNDQGEPYITSGANGSPFTVEF